MVQLQELTGVIYTRKSTVSDGKSTRDQEREGRKFCAANGIRLDEHRPVFRDEGVSASRYSKKGREAWAELKAYLRPGHILIAWEASRATRDMEEGAALINVCAELRVPMAWNGRVLDLTNGTDRFTGGLEFLLAARESDMISERVLRGVRGAVANGSPHAHAPWGYRSIPRKPGMPAQWEFDPIEAPRVREAVRQVLAGESRKAVLAWLKETGYAPASATSFGRVITNPALAGMRVHKGLAVGKGTWPALITDEQHRQLVSQSLALTTTPGPESNHLCSGIAKCGKCGGALRYRGPYRGKARQKRPALYACKNGCTGRLQSLVDQQVEKAILRRLRHMDPKAVDLTDPKAVAAQEEISRLEIDRAEWRAKAIAGDVDAETYAAVQKDRKQKIAALRPLTLVAPANVLTFENWPNGTMEEKRQTIRSLLDIRIHPMKRGHNAFPGDVDIKPK